MIYIESQSVESRKISLNEIADAIDSPVAFTAKILQKLKRNGLLTSTIGAKGGFKVVNKRIITLKDIVVAIDGDGFFNNCILGLKVCSSSNPCPAHGAYKIIKETLIAELLNIPINKFSKDIINKSLTLK